MRKITLQEAEISQLENIIQELPTKFGMPILNILNKASALEAQQKTAKKEPSKEEELPA